ncbi:MAG: type I polyketide synthase, partial [Desulfuromonadales bacterium]|nr:type I polyketide synthase [Desulfuromonadales bacterium]
MTLGQSVAIVGVGGEFPGSPNLERYWETIVNNVNTSRVPPAGRWLLPVDAVYDPQVGAPDKVYSRKACFLEDESDISSIPGFDLDPEFLRSLDPLFRLLLRVGRQTLPESLLKTINIANAGIIIGNLALPSETSSQLGRYYLGQTFAEQLAQQHLSCAEAPVDPLNHYVAGLPAGVLAKALGFQGSCLTVDAACASSLYAVALAVNELISGRADAMLAGGLSRPDSLYTQMGFSQLRALSPSGTCSPFDAKGNGLVVGEGCGLVLLKRTADALRDGDHIYALIRGVGLSNDLEGNLLAPASEGQLRAMKAAYQQAGWPPDAVDMVECHATGTPVGDKVEFNSLKTLWKDRPWRSGQCVIGSVKANVGHLLTAAGAAALIKTLLAIKHQVLPPMVNFSSPAAGIDLDQSPFRILQQPSRWEKKAGEPRRAAVSAFGFGGINAHLLIEEWVPQTKIKRTVTSHPSFQKKSEAIAIVGMGCEFGPWNSLEAFQRRVLGDRTTDWQPQPPKNWWGTAQSRWFQQAGLTEDSFRGFYIDEVSTVPGHFKIPPKELEEMLPRQLLMLKVAAAALDDAHVDQEDLLFTGVFIGSGLDLNATSFSFRWAMEKYARIWAEELGLKLDESQFSDWVDQLRTAAGPALSANRTMGALGSVVASRIAKNFRVGGPSFTLSSEENSGLKALEVAVRALQEGSINRAIVGAVDLAGDLRSALSRHALHPFSPDAEVKAFDSSANGTVIGEGAAAVILKRLENAQQDGDRIYAVIRGLGSAVGGPVAETLPSATAYKQSLSRACRRAGTTSAKISYIETEGSGIPASDQLEEECLGEFIGQASSSLDCLIGSVKTDIGHAGQAAGLAALLKTALCLKKRVIPPLRHTHDLGQSWIRHKRRGRAVCVPQYWLSNRAEGRRTALIASLGADGSVSHAVVEEFTETRQQKTALQLPPSVRILNEALFVLTADSAKTLGRNTEKLLELVRANSHQSLAHLALCWFDENPVAEGHDYRLALVAENHNQLAALLDYAQKNFSGSSDQAFGFSHGQPVPPAFRERIFFASEPLARQGKTAFVFPGSGNHFAGMGQQISGLWPHVFATQDQHNQFLAGQYLPDLFWAGELSSALHDNHNALVISHVALCTALHDLVRSFGISANMISGYSLGESAGLFASGAWTDRDGMLQRLEKSTLFTEDLAGPCKAARRIWNLPAEEKVDWVLGMVDLQADTLREYLVGKKQVYLLIINTYREAVVGGQRQQVEQLVSDLKCHFIPLKGVTTVHCEVTRAVANAYRKLHLFEVSPPQGIDVYSCALARKYPLTSDNAADVILGQALDTIDYPRVIEQLYKDGARIFIELGPGSSCSRMIDSILDQRPHMTCPICVPGQDEGTQVLRLLARCLVQGLPVDLSQLYPQDSGVAVRPFSETRIETTLGGRKFNVKTAINVVEPESYINKPQPLPDVPALDPPPADSETLQAESHEIALLAAQLRVQNKAHQSYLDFSQGMQQALTTTINHQLSLLQSLVADADIILPEVGGLPTPVDLTSSPTPQESEAQPTGSSVAFERPMCMEFAVGSVAKMLGPEFAEVDGYPTRVRLPDEPLMLVDRILQVEGVPRSMSRGRVVTEHDVSADRWYLDGGRIPTCVAVEAGQADLFLSGYLGIDFITKGLAVYRLLDAEVTFHRSLPVVGETIRYDIKIEEFFRQDQTYLFRFSFEGTVGGQPLLSMKKGCAGFFTQEELAAGRGIVHTKLDLLPQPGTRPDDWRDLVPMQVEAYDEGRINALYAGDLAGCFGSAFADLLLLRPYTLPGGKLKLVDRVVKLDPHGGRYGLGQITAEMDIHPDDWFLTCHFVDDQVMPGTLMYECCLHTLRIYLLRMGWVG